MRPEAGSSSTILLPEPPASFVWEHLAHINSLIVGTHSRHNDPLYVSEGMVDREGSRAASRPSLDPVCCGSEAGSDSRQTGKKAESVKQQVPDPRIWLQLQMRGRGRPRIDRECTDRERERGNGGKEQKGSQALGHISVLLSLQGCP